MSNVPRALAERSAAWVIESWLATEQDDPWLNQFHSREDLYAQYLENIEEANDTLDVYADAIEAHHAKIATARDERAAALARVRDLREADFRDRDAIRAALYAADDARELYRRLRRELPKLTIEMPVPATTAGRNTKDAEGEARKVLRLPVAGRNVFYAVANAYLVPSTTRAGRGWKAVRPEAMEHIGATLAAFQAERAAALADREKRAVLRRSAQRSRLRKPRARREPRPPHCWVCGRGDDHASLSGYGRSGKRHIHKGCYIEIGGRSR